MCSPRMLARTLIETGQEKAVDIAIGAEEQQMYQQCCMYHVYNPITASSCASIR